MLECGDYFVSTCKRRDNKAQTLPAIAPIAYLCCGTGRKMKRHKPHIKTDGRYAFGYGDQEGRHKIMFWDKKQGFHYTILMNDKRKLLDIHKTIDIPGQYAQPEVLKMSYRDCLKLLAGLAKLEKEIQGLFTQIVEVIGLRKLHQMKAALLPEIDETKYSVLFERKRPKRFPIRRRINRRNFEDLFIHPKEITNNPAASYTVFKKKRSKESKDPFGFIYPTHKEGVYILIRSNRQLQMAEVITSKFIEIIKQTPLKSKEALLKLLGA